MKKSDGNFYLSLLIFMRFKLIRSKNIFLLIVLIFNFIFFNIALANDENLENIIDFGYDEWVCLNADSIFISSKNSFELEKLIINYYGEASKKIEEIKNVNNEILFPFILHHYFFKNKNEVIWIEVKTPGVENNMVVSTLIIKDGFPISRDLYLGDSAEKFGKKINKKIINLSGNYKLSCDLISLNIEFKKGKIVAAKWHSMIN